jgi:hypothetical protein
MRAPVLAVILAALACDGTPRERPLTIDNQGSQSLVGAWDASLSLTQAYPLGRDQPAVRRICGTMGFVRNHTVSGSASESPSVGVYDLELSRLGLNWLGDTEFPSAMASEPIRGSSSIDRVQDSVSIVLNAGSRERILLLGQHDVAGIDGRWVAQSLRGSATGSFSLRPHRARHPDC